MYMIHMHKTSSVTAHRNILEVRLSGVDHELYMAVRIQHIYAQGSHRAHLVWMDAKPVASRVETWNWQAGLLLQ